MFYDQKNRYFEEEGDQSFGEALGAVIPIEFESDFVKVTGLVSPVGVHRASSANASYLYVNQRYVKDTALRRSISEAYHEFYRKVATLWSYCR